jgi:hypothetical protein
MFISDFCNLSETVSRKSFYDPSAVWLHGGPIELEGDALKRYGKSGSDMGALFFCKDSFVGRWYTATYANKGKIYKVKLSAPVDSILDLKNPKHLKILQDNISQSEYNFIMNSRGSSGNMDWATVDEELLEPLGFRGCVFQERPKGMETGLPPQYKLTHLPEDVLSVGIFNASDAKIIGVIDPIDIWKAMLK